MSIKKVDIGQVCTRGKMSNKGRPMPDLHKSKKRPIAVDIFLTPKSYLWLPFF